MSGKIEVGFETLHDAILGALEPEQRNAIVSEAVQAMLKRPDERSAHGRARSVLDRVVEEAVKEVAKQEALRILETPEMQTTLRDTVRSAITSAETGVAKMLHEKIKGALSSRF